MAVVAQRTLLAASWKRAALFAARPTTPCAGGTLQRRAASSSQGGPVSSGANSSGAGGLKGRAEERMALLFDTKVSQDGSPDALFQDCISAIRWKRAELSLDPTLPPSDNPITKLKEDEMEITRKIFRRVDPERQVTSDLSHGGHHIDPYWDPFHKVRQLKEQVTAEFDEYSRFVSVAEQRIARINIKKSLRRMSQVYNPYSSQYKRYYSLNPSEQPPKPFHLPDKHWEPNPLQAKLAKERITFRDIDIIHHFIADNGYILPRRTTMLPRKKQQHLVKAVKHCQTMSLIPYHTRPSPNQVMPLTDPLQWMLDRLIDRVIEDKDLRSRAMIQVMIERHPDLNYRRFLKHEAASSSGETAPH